MYRLCYQTYTERNKMPGPQDTHIGGGLQVINRMQC